MNEELAINLHEKLVRIEASLYTTRCAIVKDISRKQSERLREIEDDLKTIRQEIAEEYFI